jgi:hypothetical protein
MCTQPAVPRLLDFLQGSAGAKSEADAVMEPCERQSGAAQRDEWNGTGRCCPVAKGGKETRQTTVSASGNLREAEVEGKNLLGGGRGKIWNFPVNKPGPRTCRQN